MMSKTLIAFALLSASFLGAVCNSYGASPQAAGGSSTQPVNPVIQWNRNLLEIVRTPGAQSPTVHPTRSFAIMHAAIYDAVNAIDRTHRPYLVRLNGVHEVPPRMQRQLQRRIKFSLFCTRHLGPHSMPSYSSRWHKFRTATTKLQEYV